MRVVNYLAQITTRYRHDAKRFDSGTSPCGDSRHAPEHTGKYGLASWGAFLGVSFREQTCAMMTSPFAAISKPYAFRYATMPQ